jgi:hypothetical protein
MNDLCNELSTLRQYAMQRCHTLSESQAIVQLCEAEHEARLEDPIAMSISLAAIPSETHQWLVRACRQLGLELAKEVIEAHSGTPVALNIAGTS